MNTVHTVEQLLALAESDNIEDRRYALKSLGNRAGVVDGRAEILQLGVPTEMSAARADDSNLRRHASRGLANLTERGTVNKEHFCRFKRFRSWVQAELHDLSTTSKQNVARGGVPAMAALASSDAASLRVRRHSVRDLAWLSRAPAFQRQGGVHVLLELGQNVDDRIATQAVAALFNLATAGRIEEDVKQFDIAAVLERLLENSRSRTVRRAAAAALLKISIMMDSQNAKMAAELGKDPDALIESSEERDANLVRLAQMGVIDLLVALATSDDFRARRHALRGLFNFAQCSAVHRFMVAAGAEHLLQTIATQEVSGATAAEEKAIASRTLAFLTSKGAQYA